MKSFIALSVLALIVAALAVPITEEQKVKAREHLDICMAEFSITDDEVKSLRGGDFSDDSERFKCFSNCFLERAGFLKDGEFQTEVVAEKLSISHPKDKVDEIIAKCKDIKGENNCDTAWKITQCYHNNKAILQ